MSVVQFGEMSMKTGSDRLGGFGLYLMALLFMFAILTVLYFFPRYMSMRSGIYRISCKEIRKKIERAVAEYDANNTMSIVKPGKPIDLDFLKQTGFLAEVQYCPERGIYKFGQNGEVICTVHSEPASGSALATGGVVVGSGSL